MTASTAFNEFYQRELEALLAPIEAERKKIATLGIASTAVAIVTLALFLIVTQVKEGGLLMFLILGILASIGLYWVYSDRKEKYALHFKETIVRKIINFIDPSFQYEPASYIHENDYKKSGLFLTKAEQYQGDDYVEGMRGKTFFCFSELKTEYKESSGKDSHWEIIFKGLFFIGDFNKNFHGRTYVWSENNPQLNFFSKMFSSFARDLGKVKLESIDFEEKFIVYSTDQVEARYILTPSFMERMVKLRNMMGPELSVSFIDTNIYVAVPIDGELFEPTIFKPNNYTTLGDYYNTVHIVFDIIDELNLDLRIWNKE